MRKIVSLLAMLMLFHYDLSVIALIFIWVDKIWITQNLTLGIPTVLGTITFFSGLQLMILGLIGEYLGRLYLDHTGTPQFIVRYIQRGERTLLEHRAVEATAVLA